MRIRLGLTFSWLLTSKVTVFEPDGHGSFGKIFDRFEDAIAFLNQQGWEPMSASLDHEGVY